MRPRADRSQRAGRLPGPPRRAVSGPAVRLRIDRRGGRRGPRGARPRGRLLGQAPGVPRTRARADPAPPVGALDPGGRVGVRPPRALGRRADHGDERGWRARPLPRGERHRRDARPCLRVPQLRRAAARAAVATGLVHPTPGADPARRWLRPDWRVRRAEREGPRHAGPRDPREPGPASGRRRDARPGRARVAPRASGLRVAARPPRRGDPRAPLPRGDRGDEAGGVPRQHLAGGGRRRGGPSSMRFAPATSPGPTSTSSRPSRSPPGARSGRCRTSSSPRTRRTTSSAGRAGSRSSSRTTSTAGGRASRS